LESFPSSNAIWLHTSQTIPEAPSQIDLIGNRIFDCCQIDYGSVGIWVGYANYVRIERNHLRGLPYTGISVGWRWGPGLTNCHSNLIAKNTVEEVMRQAGDGAGIYVVGEQPGTRILENYVRDSGGNYWAHGIYMDESSDHMEVAGNYVNGAADHSLFMNRNGLNQVFRDNNGESGPTRLEGKPDGRNWADFKPERRPPGTDSAKSTK
jgi:nitrous oxidase accessory protein NosD